MRRRQIQSHACLLLLPVFIVIAASSVARAQDGVLLVDPPQIPIDPATKSGSALLQIKNEGTADAQVSLVLTEFRNSLTGQLLNTKATFSVQPEVPGKPVFPQEVKPGSILVVKVEVSNLSEAGESTATLYQNGKNLGVITAINSRTPFAVRPASATPDNVEVSFERGTKASLLLKNDDAVSYPVTWQLLVNGVTYDGKQPVILPPNESMPVEIDPPDAWFEHGITGVFKPDVQSGVLTLAFAKAADDRRWWPAKSVPIKVHLNYHPGWVRQVIGNGIILLVLIAGGVASLLVNAYLPNRLRSVAAEEKLSSLARRISGVSTKIDSRLRVFIRVERLRLSNMLKGRWHVSPDFADALTQSNEAIAALTARVDATEQIDAERHRFDSLRTKLPPTLLSRIDDDLQRAADLLRKARPSQADIDLARVSISKASELISKSAEMLSGEAPDDEFVKNLAKHHTYLKAGFDRFKGSEVYSRFEKQVPGPFKRLAEPAPDSATTSPRDYTSLDTDFAKLAVILDYISLHEARSQDLQAKLKEPDARIMEMVVASSWECIRAAQLVVRQVQCGFYEKDLREQLPQAVSIELDRQLARVDEAVEYSLRFHHPVLDRTAAREEWLYNWTFDDTQEERGWSAWHYYPSAENKTVSVKFLDAKGKPVTDTNGNEIKIEKPVNVQPQVADRFGRRARVEAARLGIGLLVAVVALAAGAKEQLLKLEILPGLLAVFVIGFAADTVKNLVTQSPPKP